MRRVLDNSPGSLISSVLDQSEDIGEDIVQDFVLWKGIGPLLKDGTGWCCPVHILSFYFFKEIPGGYHIHNALDTVGKEMCITG